MKPTYLPHLHALRGIAILTILGAHAWSFMIFWTGPLDEGLKPLFQITESLFHGSTLYFALVSGVLFSKVLSGKSWPSFFKSKCNNVVLPYAVMSMFYTGLYWSWIARSMEENGEVAHFPLVFLENLATGNAAIHFWYIPVLAFLFLMTPLLRWLMKKHLGFIGVLAALPLVVSRSTFPDFLEPQSFVYFLGAYGLGMLLGNKLDEATIFARKYKTSLVIIAILTSACVYLLFVSEYQISAWFSGVQTLIYLQKVLIFLWLLQWFESFKDNIPGALHTLGNHAFGIYFLHLFFMGIVINQVRDIASNQREPLIIFALGALSLGVAVLGSMLVGWVLQKIFKKHARKIIGV